MPELEFRLVDEASFDAIPAPSQPGARCQSCDYWERLDGARSAPGATPGQRESLQALKRSRLLAGARVSGSYAMLAFAAEGPAGGEFGAAVGYAQFGPISAYPRAQVIRDRYPDLPQSPPPWVVTCLQASPGAGDGDERRRIAAGLLTAVCAELDRRGVSSVEAYPEGVADPWLPSAGPAVTYEEAGFERVAGDESYPVYRRELTGSTEVGWDDLLSRARPAGEEDEGWPLPLPKGPREEDLFRLPPKPKRPNPFGDD